MRLPAGYVKQVIDTLNAGEISTAKAAEMLMMASLLLCGEVRRVRRRTDIGRGVR